MKRHTLQSSTRRWVILYERKQRMNKSLRRLNREMKILKALISELAVENDQK